MCANQDAAVKRRANEEGIEFDPLITHVRAAHVIAVTAWRQWQSAEDGGSSRIRRGVRHSRVARAMHPQRHYRHVPVVLPTQRAVVIRKNWNQNQSRGHAVANAYS